MNNPDCGCGTTAASAATGPVENRPGLPAIAYRIGTFGSFRQAIVDELARTPELAALSTRVGEDYTISIVELWAAVADVLTFYQERTANEAFLRTATLRDSVLRLVRLIGYELAPGLSATGWLAFSAEPGTVAQVPAGSRVRSVPLHDEPAVTYETAESLAVAAPWNLLRPVQLQACRLQADNDWADFAGTGLGLSPGDMLAFVGKAKHDHPRSTLWTAACVLEAKAQPEQRTTRVTWSPALGAGGRVLPTDAQVHVFRQRATVFGQNAPDWHLLSDVTKASLLGLSSPADLTAEDRLEWPDFDIHAPKNPNTPLMPISVGVLTLEPTADYVAEAAIAAARQAREAVSANTTALIWQAGASLGTVVTDVSNHSVQTLTTLLPILGKDAKALFGSLQSALQTVIDVANSVTSAKDFLMKVGGADVPKATEALDSAINVSAGFNLKLLELGAKLQTAAEDLAEPFQPPAHPTANPPDPGGPLWALAQTIEKDVGDATQKVTNAVKATLEPIGAAAAEKVVQTIVRAVMDMRGKLRTDGVPLPDSITDAELVGWAAIVGAETAWLLMSLPVGTMADLAQVVDKLTTGQQIDTADLSRKLLSLMAAAATLTAAGGVAAMIAGPALLSTGPAGLVMASALGPAVVPLLVGALVVAAIASTAAQPGARRVADEVYHSVMAALHPRQVPKPARFRPQKLHDDRIDLNTVYPRVVRERWALLSRPGSAELFRVINVEQTSRTQYALSGAVTRLWLAGNGLVRPSAFGVRETTVFCASEELPLALVPIPDLVCGAAVEVIGRFEMPQVPRRLIVTGLDEAGLPATDLVELAAIEALDDANACRLLLQAELGHRYRRDSVVIYGNVASASHGETVRPEVLGDGDAAQAFQTFTLKKKSVSHVQAAATGVIASTLKVLVNGVTWSQAPTLYGQGARDQRFIARIADDGTMSVRFGDGVTGARLPSGRQNILASYRQGLGAGGVLQASRLTMLLDRPTGLKAVTNPGATEGGVDPESLASARTTAPGTVRTFGRAVSLRDFEDSALTAGEVAKACATWVWNGERRAIHLTVAASGGGAFSTDGLDRIVATLATERDPNHRLLIGNHIAVPVRIAASLLVDSRRVNADVLTAARAALEFALAFEQRGYAEPVFLSDIYAVLQGVAGVVAVDIDTLDLKSTDAAFRAAHGVDDTQPQPHARLLMLPARPGGPPRTVLAAEIACLEQPAQDLTLSAKGGIPS